MQVISPADCLLWIQVVERQAVQQGCARVKSCFINIILPEIIRAPQKGRKLMPREKVSKETF